MDQPLLVIEKYLPQIHALKDDELRVGLIKYLATFGRRHEELEERVNDFVRRTKLPDYGKGQEDVYLLRIRLFDLGQNFDEKRDEAELVEIVTRS